MIPKKEAALKLQFFSTRKGPLIIITVNLLILSVIGIQLYKESLGLGDVETLHLLPTLLAVVFLLNIYLWGALVWRFLRPMESVIDTLYKALHAKPEDLPEAEQHTDEISKVSYLLNLFQENMRLTEQAARELKDQKDYLQSILETIPDAIITIDTHGKIQMANAAVEKTFGYAADELVGQKVNILMTSPDSERHDDYIERYLKTGQGNLIRRMREQTARHKSGSAFPIEIWVSELSYNSHQIFLGIIHDITERKKTEAERARYLQELESSNRELDDFAYIVSHDLKEPLRGMQVFSRFLLENYEDKLDLEGKDKLYTISGLAKRLESILDTLFYYSRLGRTALAVHETDLDSVVRGVIDTFSITLKEKNTVVEICQKLPVIICDHVRIAEVFQNLICNAIKYNDKKENRIEIGFVTSHPCFPGESVFYVKDYGIGIAEKNLEAVFKIFKRLHPRDAYGGGTGSGLAIVKKIIAQHNGQIWAESKGEGRGTTFFFTLPQPQKR